MDRWGKECRCGERRIPKDWPRCGECAQAHTRVEYTHNAEPDTRKNRTKRHKLVVALAQIRKEQPEDRIVSQLTDHALILHLKAQRRVKLAKRLPEALIEWGKG